MYLSSEVLGIRTRKIPKFQSQVQMSITFKYNQGSSMMTLM